jgi:hypothetical protein
MHRAILSAAKSPGPLCQMGSGDFFGLAAALVTKCSAMHHPPVNEPAFTEINAEILDLQTKRVDTQKQLDKRKAQNILSGIGGWLVIVPFVFIEMTTDKNAAYNSYAEREDYLRKRAADKNCTDLPKLYEFASTIKQAAFIPSGGNVKQDGASQTSTKPTRVTEDG